VFLGTHPRTITTRRADCVDRDAPLPCVQSQIRMLRLAASAPRDGALSETAPKRRRERSPRSRRLRQDRTMMRDISRPLGENVPMSESPFCPT